MLALCHIFLIVKLPWVFYLWKNSRQNARTQNIKCTIPKVGKKMWAFFKEHLPILTPDSIDPKYKIRFPRDLHKLTEWLAMKTKVLNIWCGQVPLTYIPNTPSKRNEMDWNVTWGKKGKILVLSLKNWQHLLLFSWSMKRFRVMSDSLHPLGLTIIVIIGFCTCWWKMILFTRGWKKAYWITAFTF